MAMPRLSTEDHARCMRAIGNDPTLAEALGLVAYEGKDRSSESGRAKNARPAFRIPEIFDEAEERERLRLLGSSHAELPPLVANFNSGFNNALRSA